MISTRRSTTDMNTMPYNIHNPASLTPSRTLAWLCAVSLAVFLEVKPVSGQLALPPALDPAARSVPPTHALGDWGESVVREYFKARGFETYVPQVGRNGLDLLVVKRAPNGEIVDARVVEVKTRTAAGDLGAPGTSKNGEQLSPSKVSADLDNAARNHPDPKTRQVAREVSDYAKRNPGGIKAERHVITLKDGKYTVYEGPTANRSIGRPVADASLEKTLERLAKSPDPATAKTAQENLKYLREQRATAARTPIRTAPRTLTTPVRAGVQRVVAGEAGVICTPIPPRTPFPTGTGALAGAFGAGAITGGVEAAFILVAYNNGEITAEECSWELCGAVFKAGAVTAATAAAIAAGAPFIIVAAGGMVVYVAADYLWDAIANPMDRARLSELNREWCAWPQGSQAPTGSAVGCYDPLDMWLGAETLLPADAAARPLASARRLTLAGDQS